MNPTKRALPSKRKSKLATARSKLSCGSFLFFGFLFSYFRVPSSSISQNKRSGGGGGGDDDGGGGGECKKKRNRIYHPPFVRSVFFPLAGHKLQMYFAQRICVVAPYPALISCLDCSKQ